MDKTRFFVLPVACAGAAWALWVLWHIAWAVRP
jgi:hypothetical protein